MSRWSGMPFGFRCRVSTSIVAAAVCGVAFVVGSTAAGADDPAGDRSVALTVEEARWSGAYADSLLAQGVAMDENPFAVLVRFEPDADPAAVVDLLDGIGATVVGEHGADGGVQVHVIETLAGVDHALEHLRASRLVSVAAPDSVMRANVVADIFEWGRFLSNDSLTQYQWTLDVEAGVDAVPAWGAAGGAAEVLVGVIDGGIDLDHPDLVNMIWTNPDEIAGNGIDDDGNGYIDDVNGWDFAFDDDDPSAEDAHGVHIAGIIGAERDNSEGIAGVAANVKIVPLRYANGAGWGFTSDAIEAFEYALDMGIPITNNSYGGSRNLVFEALVTANPQHLFVAAAGNDQENYDVAPTYPGGYDVPNVLNIASHEWTGVLSSFSAYGRSGVDASAPGGSVQSANHFGGYSTMTGTSMAAPHAAGIAAVMLGIDPTLTPAEIIEVMLDTTRWHDASIINAVGSGGHLDAGRAVRAADPLAPTVVLEPVPATVLTGETISFAASATGTGGDLTDDITWYVESADGTHDGSVAGTGSSIDVVMVADGRVRVRAEVTDGDMRWGIDVALLDVSTAPSAPREVVVVPGDQEISVSWVEPASAGSSPIDGYVATASPGDASCAASSSGCVIDGLENGVAYSVTVHAHSAAGMGSVAGPFGPVTPGTAPSAPRELQVAGADRSIAVDWLPSLDDGGHDLDYLVTLEPAGASCEVGPATTSCDFDDLPNGEPQSVTVVARNAVGASDDVVAVVVPSAVASVCDDVGPTTFVDVASSLYASVDIECLRALGVTNGTSPTTYSPAEAVTREQMAAFLARLFRQVTGAPCTATDASPFVDVPASSFAVLDVECLRVLGVTNGTSATTYSPDDVVTREQMAAFLARMYRAIVGA